MRRRLIPRILIACALGALTTLAVSWFIALRVPWGNPRVGTGLFAPVGSNTSSIRIAQAWQPGLLQRDIQVFTRDWGGGFSWPLPDSTHLSEVLDPAQVDASWGLAGKALHGDAGASGSEFAYGWPMPALYWWRNTTRDEGGGDFLRVKDSVWTGDVTILPTLPIWRGAVANSLCYAAIWSACLVIPMLIRSRIRRRRGHCPNCGYDLAGAQTCPECGARFTP